MNLVETLAGVLCNFAKEGVMYPVRRPILGTAIAVAILALCLCLCLGLVPVASGRPVEHVAGTAQSL